MRRSPPLALLLLSAAAAGQPARELPLDEDWARLPLGADLRALNPAPPAPAPEQPLTPAQLEQKQQTPPTDDLSPPPVGLRLSAPAPVPPPVAVQQPPPPAPEAWNDVSLYGARTLAPGTLAAAGHAGFPTLAVRVRYGATERLDVGLGFESLYGLMNELQLQARFQLTRGDVELALVGEASAALFVLKPQNDPVGARWITGHRNFNVAPGLTLSKRPGSPSLPRIYADARVLFAFDTQPYQRSPLGGVPAGIQLGWNLPARLGAEIPMSPRSSLLVYLGFDIHSRSEDAAFMPILGVGGVVGL